MDRDTEYKIRRRAYELWELAGRPAGRHLDYWVAAEKELGESRSDEALNEELEESFPASDPPASTMRSRRE